MPDNTNLYKGCSVAGYELRVGEFLICLEETVMSKKKCVDEYWISRLLIH
ncbi:hypothetical protein Q3H59_004924 [Pantoea sp. SORGH_AS 659]|nr:hypothetical protein [Pantoea sp. SORGH_AS_0659]